MELQSVVRFLVFMVVLCVLNAGNSASFYFLGAANVNWTSFLLIQAVSLSLSAAIGRKLLKLDWEEIVIGLAVLFLCDGLAVLSFVHMTSQKGA
jgi:ABC-type uncharacterized transport system permease subunit